MMRLRAIRRAAILTLTPLILIAATCVHDVRQRGPAGPWVGEVTNYGSEPIDQVFVNSHYIDALGRTYYAFHASTCPNVLLPGETGTFEVFVTPEEIRTDASPRPPLTLVIDHLEYLQRTNDDRRFLPRGDGLEAKVIAEHRASRFVLVEITNTSGRPYATLDVCANLRDAGGLLEVAGASYYYAPLGGLSPGETRLIPLYFASMPDGEVDFTVRGMPCCRSTNEMFLDPTTFHMTATENIAANGKRRWVKVIGEIENKTGLDISDTRLWIHVDGAEHERADALAIGCAGAVGEDDRIPVSFIVLTERPAADFNVVAETIRGYPTVAWYRPRVSDIQRTRLADNRYQVRASIQNNALEGVALSGICLNAYDSEDNLIGTTSLGDNRYLAPGAALGVFGDVDVIGQLARVEVVAFAQASEPPITGPGNGGP